MLRSYEFRHDIGDRSTDSRKSLLAEARLHEIEGVAVEDCRVSVGRNIAAATLAG